MRRAVVTVATSRSQPALEVFRGFAHMSGNRWFPLAARFNARLQKIGSARRHVQLQGLGPGDTARMHTTLARLLVAINAAIFGTWGIAFLLQPVALAAKLDIALTSPSAIADLRAMYGGMNIGFAIAFGLGVRYAAWLRPTLIIATLASTGLATGRLLTMAIDGRPSLFIIALLISELTGVAFGVWLLTRPALWLTSSAPAGTSE